MEDLAEIVGSALKKPSESSLKESVKLSPAEAAKSAQYEKSDANIQELKSAIAAEKNPQNKQALTEELNRQSGGEPFSDIGSVVTQAMGEKHEAAQPAPAAVLPTKAPPEDQSKVMSFGAGAGKAVGTGALALQQLAGKGIGYAGDLFGSDTLKGVGGWLNKDAIEGVKKLEAENAPYAEANPKTNLAGEVTGMVASPVNKIVPGFGAATSLTGAVVRGAAQGAILNTLTAPVTDESKSFLTEKAKQGAVGAVGGSLGATLGYGLSKAVNAGVDAVKNLSTRITSGNVETVANDIVDKALTAQGLSKSNVTQELFDGLKAQVTDAVKAGKKVDAEALIRLSRSQTLPVPVPMLQGQVTRDAMQFAKEQNLRGIHGVGEPITQTLQAQNKALIANLDAIGADKGADVVTAGKSVIDTLVKSDKEAQKGVTAAYDAFKSATGRDLDVPLQGLAQDYAAAVKSFGDTIPGAVRKQFEALGLMGGKQVKSLTINDAESLIKDINRNYDPSKLAEAHALDDLRKAVQRAITDGAGSGAGGEAAQLAQAARSAAKARFDALDATPGLKAAVHGMEPDKFIQKFILQGNEGEIKSMMGALKDPQQVAALQDAILAHIKRRVLNSGTSENGIFSQSQLKNFVQDPNVSARLTQVLGPEKMRTLKQLNEVAEDALFAPKASAVNTSNTASAAANLINEEVKGGALNSVLGLAKKVPGLSTAAQIAQEGVQSGRASNLISEAVNPSVAAQAGKTPIQDLTGLGARTGASYTGANSRKKPRQ